MSNLPCGLNGALYLTEMPANGGMGVGNNKAGAKYGTGWVSNLDGVIPSGLTTVKFGNTDTAMPNAL